MAPTLRTSVDTAESYGITLFIYVNDPAFLDHHDLFADSGHLNDPGARLFLKMVVDEIKVEYFDLNQN